MALTSQTLTFLSIFAVFLFALCCNADPFPSPSPSPSFTPTPSLSGEPDYDDDDTPIRLLELFKLALPEIGVQKKAATSETKGIKVASKQLEVIQRKINDYKPVLKKRLANPKTPKPVKTCLKQCNENFASAIDGVKASIESIHKQDLAKANIDISAISTDVDTCNDCFVDINVKDSEIKAVNDWVRGVTGDCLANLKKA